MNLAIEIGRLTRDINERTMSSGAKEALFTLAVDRQGSRRIEQQNQQDGGHRQTADFINCALFGFRGRNGQPANNKRVDTLVRYTGKGSQILVSGPITTYRRVNQSTGQTTYGYSLNVRNFQFLDNRNNGNNNGTSMNGASVSHGQRLQQSAHHVSNPFNSAPKNNNSERQAPQQPQPQQNANQNSTTQNQNTQNNTQHAQPQQPQNNSGKSPNISSDDLPF